MRKPINWLTTYVSLGAGPGYWLESAWSALIWLLDFWESSKQAGRMSRWTPAIPEAIGLDVRGFPGFGSINTNEVAEG